MSEKKTYQWVHEKEIMNTKSKNKLGSQLDVSYLQIDLIYISIRKWFNAEKVTNVLKRTLILHYVFEELVGRRRKYSFIFNEIPLFVFIL